MESEDGVQPRCLRILSSGTFNENNEEQVPTRKECAEILNCT